MPHDDGIFSRRKSETSRMKGAVRVGLTSDLICLVREVADLEKQERFSHESLPGRSQVRSTAWPPSSPVELWLCAFTTKGGGQPSGESSTIASAIRSIVSARRTRSARRCCVGCSSLTREVRSTWIQPRYPREVGSGEARPAHRRGGLFFTPSWHLCSDARPSWQASHLRPARLAGAGFFVPRA